MEDIMIEFELERPITLNNGNEVHDLHLDYEALSMADLKTANKIAKMIADPNVGNVDNASVSPRLDANLRIGIAWVAAIKGTKGLTVNDVLSLSMKDAICLSEDALSNYLFR